MKYLPCLAALVAALALLALQTLGALEYTEGASLYTRASMIAAMVAVAFLPLMVEWAWTHRARFSAVVMAVSVLAFLAYSLPATTGRTGEAKEAKAAPVAKAIEDRARIQADYDATKKLVDESNAWQPKACAGGNGKNCKAATFVLNQRQASLEKLAKQLDGFQAPPPGDLGSELWAGVIGWTGAEVRSKSVMAYALGLEAAIFGLMLFFARSLRAITETASPEEIDQDAEQLKKLLAAAQLTPAVAVNSGNSAGNWGNPGNGGGPKVYSKRAAERDLVTRLALGETVDSQDDLAARYGVDKSTVSKWLKDWRARDLVPVSQRIGRCHRLVAAE